ncbi:MAG: putative signal transduction protein with a C-terminal ATPase domain [Clostridia bacterium]|nr:putative signal transduction protein with a C-terminal ATPase domain [Clostridia bacterium]
MIRILQKKFFSLQYKVAIFSLVLIIVPLLTVGSISYVKSSEILQNKVSLSNLNTVRQIANSIELILQDVNDTSLHLLQNEQIRDFLKLSENEPRENIHKYNIKIQQTVMYLLNSKKYIHSVYIKGFNGITIDSKGINYQMDESIKKQIIELRGGRLWISDEIVNYDNTTTNVFSLVRIMNDINNISNKLAIMKINIDEGQISNIYKDKIIGEKGDFFIIDAQGKIISALNKDVLGNLLQNELVNNMTDTAKDGYYKVKLNDQDFLVTYYHIDVTGWTLINLVPLEELLKENIVIQRVMLLGIITSFIICLIFVIIFTIKVLGPLKQVRILMGSLENEDFDVSIDISGNDEIALLGSSFNKMSKRLKELMNVVYVAQIKQKEAELKALQAQINPHFLYNTLDTIYWMGRMENAFETSRLVEALSKLFRLSLNKGSEFTTVKNEVEHLKNYIIIQQKRYEGMIDFSINVSEETLDCRVVKLVIQPLVENAIYHGIEKKGESGKIDVSIRRHGDKLLYIITDDGNGADEKEINELLQKVEDNNRGFGIKNVNDRIKLYFGEEYGLKFYTIPSMGTKVVVTQPYVKGEG